MSKSLIFTAALTLLLATCAEGEQQYSFAKYKSLSNQIDVVIDLKGSAAFLGHDGFGIEDCSTSEIACTIFENRALISPREWSPESSTPSEKIYAEYLGKAVLQFDGSLVPAQLHLTNFQGNRAVSYSNPDAGLLGFYIFDGGAPTFIELRDSYYFAIESPIFASE